MEILASKPLEKTWQVSQMLPETINVRLILTEFKAAIETRCKVMCLRVSKFNLCANSPLLVIQTNLLRIALLKVDILMNDDSKCVDVNNE